MQRIQIGRFVMEVPQFMEVSGSRFVVRFTEVDELATSRASAREVWEQELARMRRLPAPDGSDSALIETRELSSSGEWMRGAYYHGDPYMADTGDWIVVRDTPRGPVRFLLEGTVVEAKEEVLRDVLSVAHAYIPKARSAERNGFALVEGRIALPYADQEELELHLEGDGGYALSIETRAVEEPEQTTLSERVNAAIATRFAPGVDVRTHQKRSRTVAGMRGSEVILELTDPGGSELLFAWEYPGEPDSGVRPKFVIQLRAPVSEHEAGREAWDAIVESINSHEPAG